MKHPLAIHFHKTECRQVCSIWQINNKTKSNEKNISYLSCSFYGYDIL